MLHYTKARHVSILLQALVFSVAPEHALLANCRIVSFEVEIIQQHVLQHCSLLHCSFIATNKNNV